MVLSLGDLELLFGNLMSLAKRTEFTLFNFDTSVDEASGDFCAESVTAGGAPLG